MYDKVNIEPMFEKYNSSITTDLTSGMRSQYSHGNSRNILGTNSVTYLNITEPIDLSNLKEFEFKVSFLNNGNFGLAPINDYTPLLTTINNYQRSKWTSYYNNSVLAYRTYSTALSNFASPSGTIFSYKVKCSLLDFFKGNVSINTWGTLSAPASSPTLKYTYASTLQADMNTPVYGTIAMDQAGWQTKLIDTSSVGLPTSLTQQQINGRLLSNALIVPTFNSPAYGSTSIINGNASISNDIVTLDGTGDYLNYGSGYNYTGNLTFGCWFKCPSTTQTRIMSTSEQVNGKGYSIMTKHNNANNQIFVISPNGTTSGVTLPYSILDNQWHHIMCAFEANVYFRVYLDGEVVYNTVITGDALYDSKAELIIGGMKNGTTSTVVQTFNGQIGGVVVLNQTLGEDNVWNVAYLTKPIEQTGFGPNESSLLTLFGSAVFTPSNELSLTSNASYALLPSNLNIGAISQQSVSVWFKATSLNTVAANTETAWNAGSYVAGNRDYAAGPNRSNGFIIIAASNGLRIASPHASNTVIMPLYNFSTNQWYKIDIAWNETTLKTYVNGVLISTTTVSGTLQVGQKNMQFGYNLTGTPGQQLYGNILDFQYKNYQKTDAEVLENYNADLSSLGL
jgi:hypothetical protein